MVHLLDAILELCIGRCPAPTRPRCDGEDRLREGDVHWLATIKEVVRR